MSFLSAVNTGLGEWEATLTTGGSSDRFGPSLSQARSGLSITTDANNFDESTYTSDTSLFDESGGIQEITIPADGTYEIEVAGAAGGIGNSGFLAGLGARMRGTFTLSEGDVLKVLVGQKGEDSKTTGRAGGGGGGSFVATNSNSPLICAGAGAGSSYNTFNGITARNHGLSTIGDGTGGDAIGSGDQGGAGFTGNAESTSGTNAKSFTNGGVGGTYGLAGGDGGFGGGGAGEASYPSGGGGGGYEGGDSGISSWSPEGNGQGGKSFNDGSNQSNSSGVNSGDGSVTITYIA